MLQGRCIMSSYPSLHARGRVGSGVVGVVGVGGLGGWGGGGGWVGWWGLWGVVVVREDGCVRTGHE